MSSFPIDRNILSCFWGVFRSSNEISSTPARIIPDAPFQLIVPFRNSDTGTLLSFLQCACGVVLVVSFSSYGVYNILLSARAKLMNDNDDVLVTYRSNLSLSQKAISLYDDDGAITNLYTADSRLTPPIRPTTLSVGDKSHSKFGILPQRLENNMSKDYEIDLDQIEDIHDVEVEYFGPVSGAGGDADSFDDCEFQTPCAGN